MGEETARAEMSAPVDLGDGVMLQPVGDIEQIGPGHLTSRFSVSGTPPPMGSNVDVRLPDSGLGVGVPDPEKRDARPCLLPY